MGRSEWVVIWEVSSSEQSIFGFSFSFLFFFFFLVGSFVARPGAGGRTREIKKLREN